MSFCHKCGMENAEGAKFCAACGTKLIIANKPMQSENGNGVGNEPVMVKLHKEEVLIPDTTKNLDTEKEKQTFHESAGNWKKTVLIALCAGCLLLGSFLLVKAYMSNDEPAVMTTTEQSAEKTTTQKKLAEMTTDLSLGGMDLGLSIDEMHQRLGQEDSMKKEDGYTYFYYPGLKVGVSEGKVTALVSDGSEAKTKRGLHEGAMLDEVIQAYGSDNTKMEYGDLVLYEYSFAAIDGKNGILRFAVNKADNKVNYISVRIPEDTEKKNSAENKQKIDITYTGGKNTQLQFSPSEITLHAGQQIYLHAGDSSGEAGYLRAMTDGNKANMGDVVPHDCISVQAMGKKGGKGSSTEILFTANAVGEAVFTIVPNYGSWENAKKLIIHIVQG